ncbi:MAG: polyprenyl synthetase family protein [Succinivibrio sp.]|nr:polyprenyl synthetase family protein [Succinivibrio sp.]
MNLKEFAPHVVNRINDFMSDYLDGMDDEVPELKEAVRYGLLLGGKRARPLLVYATGMALGQEERILDYPAAAIECIHAYSLIHDDMPEMDNDKLRRGHDTVHIKYGQDGALLAGDTLQALAFQILSDERSGLSDRAVVLLTRILSVRAGYSGMCGGQSLDLGAEKRHIALDELKLLHSKKTGALIRAAVMMGAMSADHVSPKTLEALDEYARWTGLAFQVWDDVLDVIGETAKLGKIAGADEFLEKSTYPSLIGLDKAKTYAEECAHKAIDAVGVLNIDSSLLCEFAEFTVTRDH